MMRTGSAFIHETTQEELFNSCVTASAVAAYGRAVNHDEELMFYHHIFAQLNIELEDAGYTVGEASIPGHPAEEMMNKILDEASQEDRDFFTDVAHLYNSLSPLGIVAKMQKLVDAMESETPLSPNSAADLTLTEVVQNADLYKSAIQSEDKSKLFQTIFEQADQRPSQVLSEENFEAYLIAALTNGEARDPNGNLDTIDNDGYMICACSFCGPRVAMWEQVREEGNVPEMLPLQNTIVQLFNLNLDLLEDEPFDEDQEDGEADGDDEEWIDEDGEREDSL